MDNIKNFLTHEVWKGFEEIFLTKEFLKTSARILVIVLAALIVVKFLMFFTEKLRKFLVKTSLVHDERAKLRSKTVTSLINNFIIIFITIICIMFILGELGINIAPILAGAGVLGLAISFGAQSLVKDFLTGLFILLEDQYGIGDVIKTDSHSGVVEHMSLRTTVLRDLEGNVHIIPNGEIKIVSVMTKHWARAVIDLKVTPNQDFDKIFTVIREELEKSKTALKDLILDPPELLGIDSVNTDGANIKILVKTKPSSQWEVSRALYKSLIDRFNKEDITLAYNYLPTK